MFKLHHLHSLIAVMLFVCAGCLQAQELPTNNQFIEADTGVLLARTSGIMGRLAVIQTLGDYVITIPETPSSDPGTDRIVRAWDISDPRNPIERYQFGDKKHPFLAHGTIRHRNQIYIGGWPNDAITLNKDGTLSHDQWRGPKGTWRKGGTMRPWGAMDRRTFSESIGDTWIALDGEVTAEWNHAGLTGMTGFFAMFMGDLLIYGSDQSKTGVATYDISDPSQPKLLDYLNRPMEHPDLGGQWGIGGYWVGVSGRYIVFARRGDNPGVQVVDYSDPSNLHVHCEVFTEDPTHNIPSDIKALSEPMYVGFQDEFLFIDSLKINIETCSVDTIFDEKGDILRDLSLYYIDTSQYLLPVGNLLISGGQARHWSWPATWPDRRPVLGGGMGIWVHDENPDTRPPYVAHHIPQNGRINFPVMAPLGIMIPETLRSSTIIPGETLILREVNGPEVAITYVLSHSGVLTVDPIKYLKENTTYELSLQDIQDVSNNKLAPYSFRFSTGNSIINGLKPQTSLTSSFKAGLVGKTNATVVPTAKADSNIQVSSIRLVGLSAPRANIDLEQIMDLTDGAQFSLSELNAEFINIQAFPGSEPVGSMHFQLTGPMNVDRFENFAPFTLQGEINSFNLSQGEPPTGDYQLTVTPYGESNGAGDIGEPTTIQFSIIDEPNVEPENTAPAIDDLVLSSFEVLTGEIVEVNILASDLDNDELEYRYRTDFGEYSEWSSDPNFSLNFDTTGRRSISVQVRDGQGGTATRITAVQVFDTLEFAQQNLHSSQLAYDTANNVIWAVNPDNNTVSQIDISSGNKVGEYPVANDPRSIAIDGEGRVWVTAYDADEVHVLSSNGVLLEQIALGYGSAPFGIVMSPDKATAYVSLYGKGELVRIDTDSFGEDPERIALGYSARAMALSKDGDILLVTRFISRGQAGTLWQVDTENWQLSATHALHKHLEDDSQSNGRGLPNYLSSVVLSPNDQFAFITAKKDNIDRGLSNGTSDLDDDNSVRAMAMVFDLESGRELRDQRVDFDNADSPSAAALSPRGNYLLVSLQGTNRIVALRVNPTTGAVDTTPAAQFPAEAAPQAVIVDNNSQSMLVKNFMGRSVQHFDMSAFFGSGSPTPPETRWQSVDNELLSETELQGKTIFYSAINGVLQDGEQLGKMSAEGYISCASCHIDGGHDGQTWDFSGRGEGLRNNISMLGRSGTRFGNVHWSANFDEIHDFENDIRNAFLGRGFMEDSDFEATAEPLGAHKRGLSNELDALAEYVSSLGKAHLPKSPYRLENGNLHNDATAGAVLFEQLNCNSCHRAPAFTDGVTHNVSSLTKYSGQHQPELKTPSLLGLFDSPPYLHDGSAATVAEVFMAAGGEVVQAEALNHSGILVESSSYSYLRDGAGVQLNPGQTIELDVETVNEGLGTLAIRYGATTGAAIDVRVNGILIDFSLQAIPLVDNESVHYSVTKQQVPWRAGINTVIISLDSGTIIVDDIRFATPGDFIAAQAHTVAATLSGADQKHLEHYLLSLDQTDAPEDNEEIVLGSQPSEPNPEPIPTPAPIPTPSGDNDNSNNTPEKNSGSGGGSTDLGFLTVFMVIFICRFRRKFSPLTR